MAVTSHALPSLLLHQWMSSSIIMHSFIVLLLCQCLNSLVYREKISLPSLPLCLSLTLSRSLFLLFHIFKCQLYLCGLPTLWSFDVFSSGVSGFLSVCVCVCVFVSGSSSLSVLLGVSFLCSSKSKIKEVRVALPLTLDLFLPVDASLQLFIFWTETQPVR